MKPDISVPVAIAVLLLACSARPAAPVSPQQAASADAPSKGALKRDDLTYADRIAWRSRLKWSQDCESMFDYPDKSLSGLTFYDLPEKRFLVQVTCTLGSYQGTYVFLLVDDSVSPSKSTTLTFPTYEDSGESGPNRLQKTKATELTGTPEFDGASQNLRLVNKFRGLGDCGVQTTYDLSKGDARLIRLQGKLDCDGKGPFDPHEWKNIPIR